MHKLSSSFSRLSSNKNIRCSLYNIQESVANYHIHCFPPLVGYLKSHGLYHFCHFQVDLRRAYNCEIMLSKIKIPLPDMIVSFLYIVASTVRIFNTLDVSRCIFSVKLYAFCRMPFQLWILQLQISIRLRISLNSALPRKKWKL